VLLLTLALGAGVVDAISLTALGVFTAAVTANIVLVGIALGEAEGHAALRAGIAVAGFAAGVLVTARLRTGRPGPLLAAIGVVQVVFLAVWLAADGRPDGTTRDLLAGLSAVAMGAQTAAAAVWHPGIPPTFVSGTLTSVLSGHAPERWIRVGVIVAVAAGATLGALMLDHSRSPVALVPVALTALVAIGSTRLERS
jgi:uncharacterized membrane protein YoaK (UPF0700 family)